MGMSSQILQRLQCVVVNGVAHLLHFLHGHGKAHCKALVQILPHDLAEVLHAVEVAVRLDVIGKVDDLFE